MRSNIENSKNQNILPHETSQDTTLVHYLESLVKLQAHIKGFITRRKFAPKLKALKEKRIASKRESMTKNQNSALSQG